MFLVSVALGAGMLINGATNANAGVAGLGELNDAFASDGTVVYNRGGAGLATKDAGWATVVQPDGKVIVVGETTDNGDAFSTFLIMRYLPNGTLDPSFSTDGIQRVGFGNQFARASGVVIDSLGRIVVGGTTSDAHDYEDDSAQFAVTRLLPDGDVDTTYGTNGRTTTSFSVGGGAESLGVALGANDKVVLVGYAQKLGAGNNLTGITTARFTSAGTLDNTYGTGGKTTLATGGVHAIGTAVAIDWDYEVYVAVDYFSGGSSRAAILKLKNDGTAQADFGPSGLREYPLPGISDFTTSIAIQDGGQGRVVLGAASTPGNHVVPRLVGVNQTTGALDGTFGSGGFVVGTDDSIVDALALTSNDSIVAAGEIAIGPSPSQVVAMYSPNGTKVANFGTNGSSILTSIPKPNYARGVAVGPNNLIYTAGSANLVRNSVFVTSLYGQKQALPKAPRITRLSRSGSKVSVDYAAASSGAATTGYRYRYRMIRKNGKVRSFTAWKNTSARKVNVRVSKSHPGFDFQVAPKGKFGIGPTATTRWLVKNRGRARCQVFSPRNIRFDSSKRATVRFQKRKTRCASWRIGNKGKYRILRKRSSVLKTKKLSAGRNHTLRVKRGRGTTTLVTLRTG